MQRPHITRGCIQGVVAAYFVAASAFSGRAAEVAPYEARVIVSGASVYSGPGAKFYPTETLVKGDVVEVYREKPGGWLGIRPTVNSFSWLAGRDLKLREGGLAEINKDNVASRIGSRLNDKHNAAQVRLKKSEVVEVLGEENLEGETWFKIAPPSGEFRWLQASVIERAGPVQQTAVEQKRPESAAKTDAKSKSAHAPTTDTAAATAADAGAATPLSSNPPSPAGATAPPLDSAAAAKPQTASPAGEGISRELTAIDMRLSRMAAAPVNLWNTERLEHDTLQLVNRAQTSADREAAQAMMSKINQFAAVAHRSNPPATAFAASGNPGTSNQPPITPLPGAIATTTSGGPYDSVGILRPVVSRRPGAPQFALVDDRGQVLTFVTPTPDVNLRPYLGHRVGVVGNRGYIAEFNRAHVTAARVTPLNDRIVR